jgi:ferritin-like metal-binding protein YciE
VRTLDQMTQHNASLVEETNAVIEQTEGQTHALDMIVDVFCPRRKRCHSGKGQAPGGVRAFSSAPR